jgi:two-component system KDP operon response regulator KdpE
MCKDDRDRNRCAVEVQRSRSRTSGRHPRRVVQRAPTKSVGTRYETETNYLRIYMAQLRRKLETDPAKPKHLLTEPGLGYRFQP